MFFEKLFTKIQFYQSINMKKHLLLANHIWKFNFC
ncbi:hypothetical protein SAMN06295967_102229 [Belliella buryatensis]|uniref:Uncharacterized protein n=1 Tax=Belliella buryatensis TaxID=1500549 RepID=A0A239B9M0_9BACT|nr:hypothetical protein SAMN06295967_102229 [Belliella buryatensis]